MSDKLVYAFGGGTAEGRGDQKALLGGKGAGLAEMSRLGIPVPPGFTITTQACIAYQKADRRYPEGLEEAVAEHLATVEELQRRRFGDAADPLLLSVRSGGPVSMPGMMDTVLNLGLNREIVAARIEAGEDERFLLDAYRRLLTMYGDVVMGVAHKHFEEVLESAREAQGVDNDAELSVGSLRGICERFEDLVEEHTGEPFPQDPHDQLWGGIRAVFDSWDNQRAKDYRRLHGLPEDMGTGVNVQTMVFGNRGEGCATGVAFTRSPATGEPGIYGEFLRNAQGEDVVAGTRTPQSIHPEDGSSAKDRGGLKEPFPQAYADLDDVCRKLEEHYTDMQDVEFTIEDGELYMLQTRTGKRTGPAAVRIAHDFVTEGLIDRRTALSRVDAQHVEQMLAPVFDLEEKTKAIEGGRLLAKGLPAGPGAAAGRVALEADRAAEMAADGPVLLVREETSPEDIVGMHASVGILTSRGGMTSHAAVVARGLGKPCIVGAGDLHVDSEAGEIRVGDQVYREGDELSIDGTAGEVIAGRLKPQESEVLQVVLEGREPSPATRAFSEVLTWADEERRLRVRANADTPEDARRARAFGAQGIGLCRTEHMFFAEDRIGWVRRMILARDAAGREEALAKLLPEQRGDFEGIFRAMDGLPVTVRLLDPPLHEFLPHEDRALAELAADMGVEPGVVADRAAELEETNPMLGHRGCRLGLTAPDVYEMQVEAIARAAATVKEEGGDPRPEIMIPLAGSDEEVRRLRERIAVVVERVLEESGVELEIPIGTMIEIPRAALTADRVARHADFFSFGTNDLTQMTFGFSRDDVGSFLPQYVEEGILPGDPFASIDVDGVGSLVRTACEKGRAEKPDLHLGVCGEHGGDAASITFFESVGLDYVSCSPYRVPVARLAAARAAMGEGERDMSTV